jgi:hypothetical protein
MSLRLLALHRIHRVVAGPVVAAALGATLVAACTTGSATPSPSATAPGASAPATAAAPPGPVTPPPPTPSGSPSSPPAAQTPDPEVEVPATPPRALLVDADAGSTVGALGSYTWGDGGSDSPWIVVRAGRAAAGAGPWALSFAPDVPVDAWTAAWASIRNGRPGQIAGYEQGTTGQVAFIGPTGPGPWTLKVEVRFAGGGSAVYFWRLRAAG